MSQRAANPGHQRPPVTALPQHAGVAGRLVSPFFPAL